MPCAISNLDCFPGFSEWWRKRSQECHFAFTRNIDSIFEVDPLSVVAFHASGKGFRGAAGTWKLHPHSPTWIYISWYVPTKLYRSYVLGRKWHWWLKKETYINLHCQDFDSAGTIGSPTPWGWDLSRSWRGMGRTASWTNWTDLCGPCQAERQTKLEELKEHEEELQRPQPRVHHGIVNGLIVVHLWLLHMILHDSSLFNQYESWVERSILLNISTCKILQEHAYNF